MENFKGTQGKWEAENRYDEKYEQHVIEIDCGFNESVCTIWGGKSPAEEIEANAKLIASAPEMLELLINIRNNRDYDFDKIDLLIKKITE